MISEARIEDRISESYSDLSAKLREAADFVIANQLDVATQSMRSISAASGVSPASMHRLSRALGFSGYDELRELCRGAVWGRGASFSERAALLQTEPSGGASMLVRHTGACIANISQMVEAIDDKRLEMAVTALDEARKVLLFGAFSSTGIVEYMAYLTQYFRTNWTLAGRMGAALGASISELGAEDVILIVTKTPYARRAVIAAKMAQEAGVKVIVITDSHACPASKYATYSFIVLSDSPQFFSSYAATVALIETLVAMLVARSGDKASERIRDVDARNRSLGEFWAE